MAELNFGLLNPPGSQSIGNAFVSGMDQAQESRARDLQMQQSVRKGQMDELTYRKALDTEARLNKYYSNIAANGGPKTPEEAIQAMLGSGVPHIQDMAAKLQIETLKNDQQLALYRAAKTGPSTTPTAVAAPMAPEPGSFGADVATRRAADMFAPPPVAERTNMMPGAAASVNNMGGRSVAEMIAERDRMLEIPGKFAEHRVTSLNADILRASKPPHTQTVDGQVVERQPDGTYSAVFGEKKQLPIVELQALLAKMPLNDPNRPALQAEVDKALTAQTQGAARVQQGAGQLRVAQGNLAVNQARLELQKNAPKLGLTDPADIERIAVAVADGRIPVDRLNSATARIYAGILKVDPDINLTNTSIEQAGARAQYIQNGRIAVRQTLTAVDADRAENIANGNLPPATGINADKIMNAVIKINPEYNARDYGLQTTAEKSFGTGKQGDKTRSLNVAVSHLATLDTAAAALNSGDIRVFNQFKQAWQRETGKAAPTNFNAVKELVADEIVAAVVPGVGALADRKALKDTIMANSSPAQLQGVIKQYKELLGGQLGGLEQQYNASTGKTNFKQRYLTPQTRAALAPSQNAPAVAPPPAAARPAGVGANWTFETDAAGNTAWVSPDRKSFKEAQ